MDHKSICLHIVTIEEWLILSESLQAVETYFMLFVHVCTVPHHHGQFFWPQRAVEKQILFVISAFIG